MDQVPVKQEIIFNKTTIFFCIVVLILLLQSLFTDYLGHNLEMGTFESCSNRFCIFNYILTIILRFIETSPRA